MQPKEEISVSNNPSIVELSHNACILLANSQEQNQNLQSINVDNRPTEGTADSSDSDNNELGKRNKIFEGNLESDESQRKISYNNLQPPSTDSSVEPEKISEKKLNNLSSEEREDKDTFDKLVPLEGGSTTSAQKSHQNELNKEGILQQGSNKIIVNINDDFSDEDKDERQNQEAQIDVYPRLKTLLTQLALIKNDLQHTGINLDTLEMVLSPGTYGKFIHFVMTTPIILSLLRWPLLQRSGIIVPHKELPKQGEDQLIAATDEDAVTISFKKNSFLSENFDKDHPLSIQDNLYLNENSPLMVNFVEQQNNKSFIFTSHGLLLGTEARLKTVLGLNSFYSGFETVFDGVWSALVSSLIIQGTANYYLYPEERDGTQLVDALGISSFLNILCIQSIDFFRSHLCFEAKNHYVESLAAAFNEYYIWLFIAGIPLAFGSIDALLATRQTQVLTNRNLEELFLTLKKHSPGIWNDTMGWLISVAVPDLLTVIIPPTVLLKLLPQPEVKIVLEKICNRIIWDGRLSDQQRRNLFDELLKFSGQHTQLTQMKALSMLAMIIENIHLDDLIILKEEGRDEDSLKTLLYIKIKAMEQLLYFSGHGNLAEVSENGIKNLPRFIFVHYLLWGLGYPKSLLAQPLFFAYKGSKLFFKLMFYTAIAKGIIDLINRYNDEQACINDQKIWSWIPAWQNFSCSYCGDLPIDVRYISSPVDCLNYYLVKPRTLNQLLNVFARFNLSKLSEFQVLDLSAQREIIKEKKLPLFLKALKTKANAIMGFTLNQNYLSLHDLEAIFDFLNGRLEVGLSFKNATFEEGGIKALARFLQNSTYLGLDLSNSNLTSADAIILAEGLKSTIVRTLALNGNAIGDKGIQAITENLIHSQTLTFSVENCNITSLGCMAAATAFERSNLRLLSLFLHNNPIGSRCAEAIAKILDKIEELELGIGGQIEDAGIRALAHTLRETDNLYSFSLMGYDVSFHALSALIESIEHPSLLQNFHFIDHRLNGNFNYSSLIPRIYDAISKSRMESFGWEGSGGFGWGDKEAGIFADFLQQGSSLFTLSLPNNKIGPKGMQAIANAIPKSNYLLSLNLDNNAIGAGIIGLAKYLPVYNSTKDLLISLSFDNNNITTSDMNSFVDAINGAKFNFISFNGNPIDNEGALKCVKFIKFSKYLSGSIPPQQIYLNLNSAQIDAEGALLIADALIKRKHGLWINALHDRTSLSQAQPATVISSLDLSNNPLGNRGVQALCKVLPYTNIGSEQLILDNTGADPSLLENCGLLSNAPRAYSYELIYPYLWLARFYIGAKQSFSKIISNQVPLFISQIDFLATESKIENRGLTEFPLSIHYTRQNITILDSSTYQGHGTIIINLEVNFPVKSTVVIPTNPNVVIGSLKNNHFIVGDNHTLITISENQGANLLIPGINNTLVLGNNSRDHLVIRPKQGTIKIIGFSKHDLLHIIDETIFYSDNEIICQQINSLTCLRLRDTEVQLTGTRCEIITQQIRFNNQTALEEAQIEVFQTNANQEILLYRDLLGICETFVNSVGKSALFTALPLFITEIVYRTGVFNRKDAEAFGQQIQAEFILACSNSPHIITASWLASCLATELKSSPQMVSMAGITVSLVFSVVETLLSQNASWGLMTLQMGTAMLGSLVGCAVVHKLPELGVWGLNKACEAKNYVGSKISFWYRKPVENKEHNLLEYTGEDQEFKKWSVQ